MKNNNDIIHKIVNYLPNEKIKFSRNKYDKSVELIFFNEYCLLNIYEKDNWNSIKIILDKLINKKYIFKKKILKEEINKEIYQILNY
tara:strand:+ start:231 stop:491 length:261 start_codon:yes stop_codon:yes gene_type:complete